MVFDFTLDEDDVASLDGMDIVSNTYLRGARDDVVYLVFSMGSRGSVAPASNR